MSNIRRIVFRRACAACAGLAALVAHQAAAQGVATAPASTDAPSDAAPAGTGADAGADTGDIVVTARLRRETSIAVPVTLTAVSGAELARRGVVNLDNLARVVPGLVLGNGGAIRQGGALILRGIGAADASDFADLAVSFNIDGVPVAKGFVRRFGNLDLENVQVLKGPQALFYGKNSPAGIIVIKSANPTDHLEAGVTSGFEIGAREIRTEGYVSGPLTDTLGARLAVSGDHMRGYIKSVVPASSPLQPGHEWGPRTTEFAGRATLLYKPSPAFTSNFKLSYLRGRGDDTGRLIQITACPNGFAQPRGTIDDCTANNQNSVSGIGPKFGQVEPRFGDGHRYLDQDLILMGLENTARLADHIQLVTDTSYYRYHMTQVANFSTSYAPAKLIAAYNNLTIREFNQEARIQSDLDFPVNFTVGGLFNRSWHDTLNLVYRNPDNPVITATAYHLKQDGWTYSGFGQLRWNIFPKLELAGGARYTKETKKLPFAASGAQLIEVPRPVNRADFHDVSPEVTLTYRPTQRLTLFGGYKKGFLSGGFQGNANYNASSIVYRPQTVRGFEGGIKASLLDGALRANLALYDYDVRDLQLTVTVSGVVSQLRNAASARVKGVEFDMTYRTPITGLSVSGALNYNRARYDAYLASCYAGETTPTCSLRLSPISGQLALSQDLTGAQLSRAPDWNGNAGVNYETPVSDGLTLGFGADMSYSSPYYTEPNNRPSSLQRSFQLYNAQVHLTGGDGRWDVAVLGQNLTNKFIVNRSADVAFTGTAAGTAPGPNVLLGDSNGSVSRGREVLLRLTYKFAR